MEYPMALEIWDNYHGDLCSVPSSPQMTVVCRNNAVTELKIKGDKLSRVSYFHGDALPNLTLSQNFSIDSFVTTLSRLSGLRVLSLVSLGIWGPLPGKIHRLSSLESLDLSSNFLFGSITPKIPKMVKLQTLAMDGNYFNDTVPDWLDSLKNLTNLSLKNNQLRGRFPSAICRIKTLTAVALSHNGLSGKLPDMSALSRLRVLDLRGNHFVSHLPPFPKSLVTVLLGNNSLSGEIPERFGELSQLRHLDLSYNFLSGTPPSVLFSLPNLTYMNLASNMLSGLLPAHLSCDDGLGFIDISTNKFVGRLPSCLGTTSGERVVKFDGNCFNDTDQHQQPTFYCLKNHTKDNQSVRKYLGVLSGAIGVLVVLVLLAIGLLILLGKCISCGRMKQDVMCKLVQADSPTGFSSELVANARLVSHGAKLGPEGRMLYRLFSLEELKKATNNFDQSNLMGRGSIGELYKGKLESGACVAVRSVSSFKQKSIQNLKSQLGFLSKLHHPHLVGLLGHCLEDEGADEFSAISVFLVYEYVPGGNYRAQLSEGIFKWPDRLGILIGIGKAVHFLHTGISPGCFNNRLTINNILVDEHGVPKLSDYGLSIIAEENAKHEAKADGPKSKSWRSEKCVDDVSRFGFILLESLVGPVRCGRGEAFVVGRREDWRRKGIDPVVVASCAQESLSIVVSITNKCVCSEARDRPSFEDVLWNLQYAAQVQAASDADRNSDFSDSS